MNRHFGYGYYSPRHYRCDPAAPPPTPKPVGPTRNECADMLSDLMAVAGDNATVELLQRAAAMMGQLRRAS